MARISDKDSERLGLSAAQRTVHEQSLVIDLHVDCIIQQRLFGYDPSEEHDPGWRFRWRSLKFDALRAWQRLRGGHQPMFNHADIPRMLRAGYSCAAFPMHYWPRQSERGWDEINRQLDYLDELLARDPRLVPARGPDDVRMAAAAGKLAVLPAIEGFHCLGAGGRRNETRRLDRIEELFVKRGVRYITLAHFCPNDVVTHGFGPGGNPRDGIGAFGREVVKKMNEVGMLVDVAHVNHRGVMDVCETSTKPVIASHSGLVTAMTHKRDRYLPRLLRDEALLAVAQTGGTVGIILAPRFLSGSTGGLSCVVQHLRHGIGLLEAKLGEGASYFSIGSDFEGWITSIPHELADVADMPLLTAALLDAGLSADQVQQIWGESFLRSWEHTLAS